STLVFSWSKSRAMSRHVPSMARWRSSFMKASVSLATVVFLSELVTLNGCGESTQVGGASAGGPVIHVVSNRADLISGDEALIDIVPPAGTDSDEITVTLNGADVTGQFSPTAQGTWRGLVTGLARGENIIAAS